MASVFDKILIVAAKTGIDIYSKSRSKNKVLLRQALYYELHEKGFSYPEIAAYFHKNHTTIMYAVRRINMDTNPYLELVKNVMR